MIALLSMLNVKAESYEMRKNPDRYPSLRFGIIKGELGLADQVADQMLYRVKTPKTNYTAARATLKLPVDDYFTVDAGGRLDIKMDDSALKGNEIEMGVTVYFR